MHLSLHTATATESTAAAAESATTAHTTIGSSVLTPGRTTVRATPWLVGVAFFCVILLFLSSKRKCLIALHAR